MGSKSDKKQSKEVKNWSGGGVGHESYVMVILLFLLPAVCQVVAFLSSDLAYNIRVHPSLGFAGLFKWLSTSSFEKLLNDLSSAVFSASPSFESVKFLSTFFGVAILIDILLPGPDATGPETATGHVPHYKDNGLLHCIVFCALYFSFSDLGLGFFDFGIFYTIFPNLVSSLNIFGLLLAAFLNIKGLYFPSTADSGTTGSFISDYAWGTELYPRVFGLDIKRFINCRFSMTFWMIAGLSFSYSSYKIHGFIDYGLLFSAISQFLYLVKFFIWEIGYLRSIDIILDRAGWQIQWGCLVWVPAIYTLHTRSLVRSPSQISFPVAFLIFLIGMLGVYLNYVADVQRQNFRELGPEKAKIWGRKPRYVEARYKVGDQTKTSTLLADGFWRPARHFHYVFELTAAWSWTLLSNPFVNGAFPLFYSIFLTMLLLDRAKRDAVKCRNKYGEDYDKYAKVVPYLVIPGIY